VKFKLKTALSGAVTAAVVGGGFLAFAPAASAAQTAPPWEPDGANAAPYGNIAFYDANGVQVTSGTNLNAPFAFAVGTTVVDTGNTKATLNFYVPGSNGSSLPAQWTSPAVGGTGSNTFTPVPTGTPANLAALDPTAGPFYPVDNTSTVNLNTYLGAITPPAGVFANITQVRITESGVGHSQPAGTYWASDIAYNTTAAAITVDGTTVPANGWAQIFPFNTAPATATTLTTNATAGHVVTGNSITLTATTAASAALPGFVVFENNGTAIADVPAVVGGPTTFTYIPTTGSYSYSAIFTAQAPPGVETGAGTASASMTSPSASSAVAVSVSPPQTATTTALTANPTSITFGGSDTLTATVTAADSTTQPGTVGFFVGATPITGCTSVAINPPTSAVCTTTALPQGTDSVTATFTPTSSSYAPSTSSPVTVTVAAPAACSLTGSSCTDTQNITVTVNPGTITITTPYTASNPFVLPAMTLSTDGTFLQSSATFPATTLPNSQQIVVTSQLAPAFAWTLSVSATNLSNGGGGTIASTGLGLTNGALLNPAPGTGSYGGTVTFTGIPAHNPSPADPDTNTGLTATPQTWAHSTATDGTAEMNGLLTLLAPTSTPSGTYTGTITFSVS
jgi:hypothetical protein